MAIKDQRQGSSKVTFLTKPTGFSNYFKHTLKLLWSLLLIHWIGFIWTIHQLFVSHKKFNINDIKLREGQLAIVTGGSEGIGAEVVRKLYQTHMHVIIGCRDVEKGEALKKAFINEHQTYGGLQVIQLDLSSFSSVRSFATKVLERNSRINLLVNNAGVMFTPYQVTQDHFEYQLQTNYLGHFLLTRLLTPALITGGSAKQFSRIVNVSSVAHYGGYFDPETFDIASKMNPYQMYMNAKFMLVAMSNFLNNKFYEENSHVQVTSVHPGIVNTNLYQNVFYHPFVSTCFPFIYLNIEQGADTVLYAALSRDREQEGGAFIINCSTHEACPETYDPATMKSLWNLSCSLTNTQIARHSPRVRKPVKRYSSSLAREVHLANSKNRY